MGRGPLSWGCWEGSSRGWEPCVSRALGTCRAAVGRGDPGTVILSLWSTLKATISEPPTRKVRPPSVLDTRCFPTPWGSGSRKQLRNQEGSKLARISVQM